MDHAKLSQISGALLTQELLLRAARISLTHPCNPEQARHLSIAITALEDAQLRLQKIIQE